VTLDLVGIGAGGARVLQLHNLYLEGLPLYENVVAVVQAVASQDGFQQIHLAPPESEVGRRRHISPVPSTSVQVGSSVAVRAISFTKGVSGHVLELAAGLRVRHGLVVVMQALVAVMRAWLLDVDWRLMQLHLWVAIHHHVMLDSFHLTRGRHETV